jgi:hypothetical protein
MSDDERWAHCTQESFRGNAKYNAASQTYAHFVGGASPFTDSEAGNPLGGNSARHAPPLTLSRFAWTCERREKVLWERRNDAIKKTRERRLGAICGAASINAISPIDAQLSKDMAEEEAERAFANLDALTMLRLWQIKGLTR